MMCLTSPGLPEKNTEPGPGSPITQAGGRLVTLEHVMTTHAEESME